MSGRYSKFLRGLLLIVLVTGSAIATLESQFASAQSPAAGTCSDSSGELICNVSGEQLDFSRATKPESKTQTASSSSVQIGVGLALGAVVRYENVFTGNDGTVVDALVTIDSLPGGAGDSTYILDQDRASSDGIKPIDMSNLQGTLSVAVTFVNDDDDLIKLQNMQVVTKDLDSTAGESAEFSGLVSYSLNSGSYIQVDASVSGVRRFTSSTDVGLSDERGWVSVTFPTTAIVGLTGNISTTSRSIPFDFDSRTVWSSSPTVTSVAPASYEVSFDLDGGVGDIPSAVSGTGELTFPSAGGQSKNGISISSWSASSGGGGARVTLGGTYTPISDTTFYAVYDGASVGIPSATSGTVGQAFSSTVTTSGFASSDLTFTIGSGSLPAGLALNSSTGAITGTPTAAGNQSITLTATHSAGGSATSSSFTLTVAKGSQSISWSPTTDLTLGDSGLTLAATRTVGDGTLGYSVVSQGTTGCAISGTILTFSSTGTGADGCEVRPTLTETSNYKAKTDASTVIFNVTSTPITTPDAPTSLVATAGNEQVSVAFTTPADDGGSAITDYEYELDASDTWISGSTTSSPVVITSLTNGTSYSIKLRAVSAAGNGTPSSAVTSTPANTTPPTFDVAPSVSSVTSSGFTPSASIDEAGVIYYVVVADGASAPSASQVKAGQDATGSAALASDSAIVSSTPFTSSFSAITSLSANTAYEVYFVAEDDEGTANLQSSVIKVDTQTLSPSNSAPAQPVPGVPLGGVLGLMAMLSWVVYRNRREWNTSGAIWQDRRSEIAQIDQSL